MLTHEVYYTVHGVVQGWTTVNGAPVAIVNERSTYHHEVDSGVGFLRWNRPSYTFDPASFMQGAGSIQYTFNWFYVDTNTIAYYQSGLDPIRATGVDPNLPSWGTGQRRLAGLPLLRRPPPPDRVAHRLHPQLEQQAGAGLRAPPTTTTRTAPCSACCRCSARSSPSSPPTAGAHPRQPGDRHGDRRVGRPHRHHRAARAAHGGAEQRPAGRRAGDAGHAAGMAERRRPAPQGQPRRTRSTPTRRASRSWTSSTRASSRRSSTTSSRRAG